MCLVGIRRSSKRAHLNKIKKMCVWLSFIGSSQHQLNIHCHTVISSHIPPAVHNRFELKTCCCWCRCRCLTSHRILCPVPDQCTMLLICVELENVYLCPVPDKCTMLEVISNLLHLLLFPCMGIEWTLDCVGCLLLVRNRFL